MHNFTNGTVPVAHPAAHAPLSAPDDVYLQNADMMVSKAICYVNAAVCGWILFGNLFRGREYSQHIEGLKAFGAYVAILLWMCLVDQETALMLINPWNLSLPVWSLNVFVGTASKFFLDEVAAKLFIKYLSRGKLSFRNNEESNIPDVWMWIDSLYIAIANLTQGIIFCHLAGVNMYFGGLSNITFTSVVLGPMFFVFLNDVFYGLTHYIMHHRYIYAYVHKHHHRHLIPERGYDDVMNYHPLEQLIGSLALAASACIVGSTTGIFFGCYVLCIAFQVTINCLNHREEDVRFDLGFLSYESGAHEMHHRLSDCNFTLYSKNLDRLFGTYLAYRDH